MTNRIETTQGLPPLKLEWLDEHVKVALETPFYYLEDDQAHIPHFPKARAPCTSMMP